MKLGFVAVFRDKDTNLVTTVSSRADSRFHQEKLETLKHFDNDDSYAMEFYFATTNEQLFYEMRLKSALLELRNYCEYSANYLDTIISQSYYEESKKLVDEITETLMRRVAVRCGQAIRRDIDVTDELAIHCYNWRQQKLNRI